MDHLRRPDRLGARSGAAERIGARNREEEDLDATDALAVGTAQALSLIPGASRSGTTITAGLFRGLNRETAARFSFLLSIPAVLLSALYESRKIGDKGGAGAGLTGVALVISFVVGLASIAWLLRYLHAAHYFRVHLLPDRPRVVADRPARSGVIAATSKLTRCPPFCSSATD